MNIVEQGIELIGTKEYEELSRLCAKVMIDSVLKKPDSLFCLATGNSPSRAYEIFVETVKKEQIDVRQLRILKLDEWWRVKEDDLCTCENFLQEKIIRPMNIPSKNYIKFDSDTENAIEECKRIAELIKEQGPIDLCILGLGKNGHLGLNEPGDYFVPYTHCVELNEKTKTHAMLSKTSTNINFGMTIGMADIITSKKVLFLVTGDEKSDPFSVFLKGQVRSDLPASILWLHENAVCLYERDLLHG